MAEPRTVLTTGANAGIGRATLIAVAKAVFDSAGSVRSAAKARQVRSAAGTAGVNVRTVLLDVREPAACARVIGRLKPWAVVNNAGYPASGAIEDWATPKLGPPSRPWSWRRCAWPAWPSLTCGNGVSAGS